MNIKSFVSGAAVLVLATSCHFYKEYDKESFPTYSWRDGQEVAFNPKIEDNSKTYQVMIGLRHHYGFRSKSFGVNVKIVSPSGKESSKDYNLQIRDENDKPIGSCAGDLCDLEAVIFDELRFEETGEYKILISHNEKGYRIPGVMEVGIIIDEKD